MTKSLTLVIPGTPVGKGRPRFNGNHVYTPKKTSDYEKLIETQWYSNGRKCAPADVPVRATITAFFPVPKSRSNRVRNAMASGEIPYMSKPDLDNIAKACLDALNGAAYHDDSQITSMTVQKRYAWEPHCEIRLEWEDGDDEV